MGADRSLHRRHAQPPAPRACSGTASRARMAARVTNPLHSALLSLVLQFWGGVWED